MWKLVPKNNKQTENAPLLKKKKKDHKTDYTRSGRYEKRTN